MTGGDPLTTTEAIGDPAVVALPRHAVLVRHGATAWTKARRHTGTTDLALDADGEREAALLGARLSAYRFDRVLASPLKRALRTCELAGLGAQVTIVDDLREWDYGRFEGWTTEEIRAERPGWSVFTEGCPEGESPLDIAARLDAVLAELAGLDAVRQTTVAIFAHGHILRALSARWLGCSVAAGRYLPMAPAAISVLGHEHGTPVISRWNS